MFSLARTHQGMFYKVDKSKPTNITTVTLPARDDAHYWVLPRAQQVRQGHVH